MYDLISPFTIIIFLIGFACIIVIYQAGKYSEQTKDHSGIIPLLILFSIILFLSFGGLGSYIDIGKPDNNINKLKTGTTWRVIYQEPTSVSTDDSERKNFVTIRNLANDEYFSFFSEKMMPESVFIINNNREPVTINQTP